MPKNIIFNASEPLTIQQMNSLLQDGQIKQEIGTSQVDLMSQNAIKTAIENSATNVIIPQKSQLGNNITLQSTLEYLGNKIVELTTEINNLESKHNSDISTLSTNLSNALNGTTTITKLKVKQVDLVD